MERFIVAFEDSDQVTVVAKKIQNLQQRSLLIVIYATKFQRLTCDHDWNNEAFITQFQCYLRNNVKN